VEIMIKGFFLFSILTSTKGHREIGLLSLLIKCFPGRIIRRLSACTHLLYYLSGSGADEGVA